MNPLPTVSQIQEIKHFLVTDLFGAPTIARLTGVRLRDVFRIARSMGSPITVGSDGTVIDGQHRLLATLQN